MHVCLINKTKQKLKAKPKPNLGTTASTKKFLRPELPR
jgi:hypothetical protein